MIIPITEASEGQRSHALAQMKLALSAENTVPMDYIGGTLGIAIGPECSVTVVLDMEELTQEEAEVAARLYIANKTESHAYYKLAQEILGTPSDHIRQLRIALERSLCALKVMSRNDPVRDLDEVILNAEHALETTK